MSSSDYNTRAKEHPPLAQTSELCRIEAALRAATVLLGSFEAGQVRTEYKERGDPVTTADRAVNHLLFEMLPQRDEGWLSEETADNASRLYQRRVWIVDPLDGTQEFVDGLPEWCVSIGLIEDGRAVAGGVCNPATGEIFLGSPEAGIMTGCDLEPLRDPRTIGRPVVLASRSEMKRGEWDWLRDSPFEIRPLGSIAYKLALVAAGFADATWTFTPKHEWDVAAGVALVEASGGRVMTLGGEPLVFNRPVPCIDGLVAFSFCAQAESRAQFKEWLSRRCSLCTDSAGAEGRGRPAD